MDKFNDVEIKETVCKKILIRILQKSVSHLTLGTMLVTEWVFSLGKVFSHELASKHAAYDQIFNPSTAAESTIPVDNICISLLSKCFNKRALQDQAVLP